MPLAELIADTQHGSRTVWGLPTLKYYSVIAGAAACLAFVAAIDDQFGGQTAQWIIDLCFPDGTVGPMPDLPMKHGITSQLWAAGAAFLSVSFFIAYRQSLHQNVGGLSGFSDSDFRLLALLSVLCNSCDRLAKTDIPTEFSRWSDRELTASEVAAARALFSPDLIEADLDLFKEASEEHERSQIICSALTFLRTAEPSEAALKVTAIIADAMKMGPQEIAGHWSQVEDNQLVTRSKPFDILGRVRSWRPEQFRRKSQVAQV